MDNLSPFAANVPIVGQKFRPVNFHPIVNLLCDCGDNGDSTLITVFGIGAPIYCAHCKTGYVIAGLKDNTAQIHVIPKKA